MSALQNGRHVWRWIAIAICIVFADVEADLDAPVWKRTGIGMPTVAVFSHGSAGPIFVGSDLGVVASLSKEDGSTLWRYPSPGRDETIKRMLLDGADGYVVVLQESKNRAQSLRVLAASDGALLWESAVCSSDGRLADAQIELVGNYEVAVLTCSGDISIRNIKNGKVSAALQECEAHELFTHLATWTDSERVTRLAVLGLNEQNNRTMSFRTSFESASSVKSGKDVESLQISSRTEFGDVEVCSRVKPVQVGRTLFACSSENRVIVFNVVEDKASIVRNSKPSYMISTSYPVLADSFVARDYSGAVYVINLQSLTQYNIEIPLIEDEDCMGGKYVVIPQLESDTNMLRAVISSGPEKEVSVALAPETTLAGYASRCFVSAKSSSLLVLTRGGDLALLVFEEDNERIDWVREEGLSYIEHAVFCPAARPRGQQKPSAEGIFRTAVRALSAVKDISSPAFMRQGSLDEDRIIVAVSSRGKAFGLSSSDGSVLWSRENASPSADWRRKIYKLSDTTVALMASSDWKSVVDFVDVRNGAEVADSFMDRLGIVQAVVHENKLVVFTVDGQNQILPREKATDTNLEGIYWLLPSGGGTNLQGFRGGQTITGGWQIRIPSDERVHSIAATPDEGTFLASPARVRGDRGILHKYVNRGAVAVITQPVDGKLGVTYYLIDTVLGSVLDSTHHANGTGPASIVRCENWVLYSFWDAALREQLVYSIDFYEEKKNWFSDAFHTALTGLVSGVTHGKVDTVSAADIPRPFSYRSGFVARGRIGAMAVSTSAMGITMRTVFVAVDDSRVVLVPKVVLDPRRPINGVTTEHKSEMLMPYEPALSLVGQYPFVTKDEVVLNINNVYTAPVSVRESSSHVLVAGIDLFYTAIAPMGKYDALTDSFNYRGVIFTVGGAFLLSVVLRVLSHRSNIRRQWTST
mmetsp:Transcript_5713/g.16999  ORF Transcript_5713/g.16999 Transcript_5713/m.16999 type:complete len:925 (+) Transcript_5713:79-2853(+)